GRPLHHPQRGRGPAAVGPGARHVDAPGQDHPRAAGAVRAAAEPARDAAGSPLHRDHRAAVGAARADQRTGKGLTMTHELRTDAVDPADSTPTGVSAAGDREAIESELVAAVEATRGST